MIRHFHWAAAVVLLLPSVAVSNSGIIQVTGLRSWSHPGSTRVVVETSGLAEFHADRATNPERLFFDVLHARPLIDGRRVATRQINDRLVKRIRIAETTPGTTRVVFDLSDSVDYKVSRLDTPDRIVIELTPGNARKQITATPVVTPTYAPAARPRLALGVPALVTTSSRPGHKVFVPPVLPSVPWPIVPQPAPVQPIEVAALTPLQLQESWMSLAYVRMPRKPSGSSASSTSASAPFVNTTTRVLPPTRPAVVNAAAKASTDASLSLTRALGLKINRVVIDAGHGGHDDGTIGPNGVLEKDVVLDVALRLAKLVQTGLGAEVVLTRSDDTFVPLTERTAIANEHKADLFLSIHANSSPTPAVAGTETFLLNLNSSPGAITVAARENAGSDKSVSELRDLVQSIALNDKIAESQSFAANIQSSIFTQAAKANTAAHDRGVKKAPFVVLIGARMPSVLAEIGFLSNPRDESNLSKPEYRQKIAESLYRGIEHYSLSLSHFEVAGIK